MNDANPVRPALVLSRLDCDRLEALLEQPAQSGAQFDALRDELARAEVREPRDMPADAITMNSTARFRDETTGDTTYAVYKVVPGSHTFRGGVGSTRQQVPR